MKCIKNTQNEVFKKSTPLALIIYNELIINSLSLVYRKYTHVE
jgi:hypothetical protein